MRSIFEHQPLIFLIFVFIGGSSELLMWLTDGFSVTFFGRWWALCGGDGTQHWKTPKFGNLQIAIKVAGSTGSHIGWQPS